MTGAAAEPEAVIFTAPSIRGASTASPAGSHADGRSARLGAELQADLRGAPNLSAPAILFIASSRSAARLGSAQFGPKPKPKPKRSAPMKRFADAIQVHSLLLAGCILLAKAGRATAEGESESESARARDSPPPT